MNGTRHMPLQHAQTHHVLQPHASQNRINGQQQQQQQQQQQPHPIRMPLHNPAMQPFPPNRSPPNIENTKHVPCKFYPLGSCNAGDACKFSHNLETAQDRQPCKYFQKGNCKFGAKCALLHIIDGRPVNDPVAQQINPPTGFQRQMPLVGNPQVSGLSSGLLGMQQLGNNQAPPPPTYQNGYHSQQQSYFTPQSPTMDDGHFHSAISSQHNSPPSPPNYRSGLSSALRNHENEADLPRSSSMSLLGPLDAGFPSSVDLTNNHIARHGPFAASVPSKFGIPHSGISSLAGSVRERVVTGDYPGSGTQSPVHGDYGSRYGSPIDSLPWSQDFSRSGGSLFLQSIQQQRTNPASPMHSRPQSSSSPFVPFDQKPAPPPSRLNQLNRTRLTPISSSVPAAHFGEKALFSPIPAEDEEALDHDALPSSLHDEVLLPQELNRRSSQSHTPGINRRSSAYDEFARSPPSGAVTPGSERGGGGGSLAGSPGSSRIESLWGIKLPDDNNPLAEMSSLNLSNNNTPSSRQRVASPLRHPLETAFASSAPRSALKTPSVHAAQKWGGRTAEKLFPHVNGESPHAVNVPGVAWRRTGDITVGRGELSSDDVRRIKEEEEGTQFSME